MFTGIIQTKGKIKYKVNKGAFTEITVAIENEIKNPYEGMSIAVNGVCLTAKKIKNRFEFFADLSEETIKKTTFKNLKIGDMLNIEFPVTLNDFLSGHIVSGHIDTVAKVIRVVKKTNTSVFTFEINKEFKKYIVEKGSIAIDGVSLTMYNIKENKFDITLIPETMKRTIADTYKTGTEVNIEFDIIGKYVEKFLRKEK